MVVHSFFPIAIVLASVLSNTDGNGPARLHVNEDGLFDSFFSKVVVSEEEEEEEEEDCYPDIIKVDETVEMNLKCEAKTDYEKAVGSRVCEEGFKDILNAKMVDAKDLAEQFSTKFFDLQSKMMPGKKESSSQRRSYARIEALGRRRQTCLPNK
jgi:hypothetical protein